VTITRIQDNRCRLCDRPLTDPASRVFRIGSECRKGMTPAQLRAAIKQAAEEADPGYIPPARPATGEALATNADARTVAEQASAPARNACVHGGMRGACPMCRREEDPTRAAERIITKILAERMTARQAAWDDVLEHREAS